MKILPEFNAPATKKPAKQKQGKKLFARSLSIDHQTRKMLLSH